MAHGNIDMINLLCRLCGKQDNVCVDVFGEDGNKHSLEKKIRLCLPITVTEEDEMPKQVCLNCLNKLDTSYDLYLGCVSAQNTIKKLLETSKMKASTSSSQNFEWNMSHQMNNISSKPLSTKGGSLITLQPTSNIIKVGSSVVKLDDYVSDKMDVDTDINQSRQLHIQNSPAASDFTDLVKNSILISDGNTPVGSIKPVQMNMESGNVSMFGTANNSDMQTIYIPNSMMMGSNQQLITSQNSSMPQSLQVPLMSGHQNTFGSDGNMSSGVVLQDLSSPQFLSSQNRSSAPPASTNESLQSPQFSPQNQKQTMMHISSDIDRKPSLTIPKQEPMLYIEGSTEETSNVNNQQLSQIFASGSNMQNSNQQQFQLHQQQLMQMQQQSQQQPIYFTNSSGIITNINESQQYSHLFPSTSSHNKNISSASSQQNSQLPVLTTLNNVSSSNMQHNFNGQSMSNSFSLNSTPYASVPSSFSSNSGTDVVCSIGSVKSLANIKTDPTMINTNTPRMVTMTNESTTNKRLANNKSTPAVQSNNTPVQVVQPSPVKKTKKKPDSKQQNTAGAKHSAASNIASSSSRAQGQASSKQVNGTGTKGSTTGKKTKKKKQKPPSSSEPIELPPSPEPVEVELSDTEDDVSKHSPLCTCESCKPGERLQNEDKTTDEECEYCHVVFPLTIIDHHRKLHFRESFYSCIDCNKNFYTNLGLQSHKCKGDSS